MNKIAICLILAFLISCDNNDSEMTYDEKIDLKVNEIVAIISNSTAESANDCETYFVSGGNGCGPMFVYGKNNLDTAKLFSKFRELNNIKQEYFDQMEVNGTPIGVCDILFPDTIILIDKKCYACYKESINECDQTSVLFY